MFTSTLHFGENDPDVDMSGVVRVSAAVRHLPLPNIQAAESLICWFNTAVHAAPELFTCGKALDKIRRLESALDHCGVTLQDFGMCRRELWIYVRRKCVQD